MNQFPETLSQARAVMLFNTAAVFCITCEHDKARKALQEVGSLPAHTHTHTHTHTLTQAVKLFPSPPPPQTVLLSAFIELRSGQSHCITSHHLYCIKITSSLLHQNYIISIASKLHHLYCIKITSSLLHQNYIISIANHLDLLSTITSPQLSTIISPSSIITSPQFVCLPGNTPAALYLLKVAHPYPHGMDSQKKPRKTAATYLAMKH